MGTLKLLKCSPAFPKGPKKLRAVTPGLPFPGVDFRAPEAAGEETVAVAFSDVSAQGARGRDIPQGRYGGSPPGGRGREG